MESLSAGRTSTDGSSASTGANNTKAKENTGGAIRLESILDKIIDQWGSAKQLQYKLKINLLSPGVLRTESVRSGFQRSIYTQYRGILISLDAQKSTPFLPHLFRPTRVSATFPPKENS
jgi:hypothetical protein